MYAEIEITTIPSSGSELLPPSSSLSDDRCATAFFAGFFNFACFFFLFPPVVHCQWQHVGTYTTRRELSSCDKWDRFAYMSMLSLDFFTKSVNYHKRYYTVSQKLQALLSKYLGEVNRESSSGNVNHGQPHPWQQGFRSRTTYYINVLNTEMNECL